MSMMKQRVLPLLVAMVIISVGINLYKLLQWNPASDSNDENGALQVGIFGVDLDSTTSSASEQQQQSEKEPAHRVAGLHCPAYPSALLNETLYRAAQEELVYWKDIPADSLRVSPYQCPVAPKVTKVITKEAANFNDSAVPPASSPQHLKFLTFEPDEGGWNNIRMAMETAITMAIAMGRILVLPPQHKIYLLWEQGQKEKQHKLDFNFDDFFHLHSIQDEMAAFQVISFQDFLEQYVVTGRILADPVTGQALQPPDGGRTDWNGRIVNYETARGGAGQQLWTWWRSVATPLTWKYDDCMAVFPQPSGNADHCTTFQQSDTPSDPTTSPWIATTADDEARVQGYLQHILQQDQQRAMEQKDRPAWRLRVDSYVGNPTPVNASSVDRMAEMLADRTQLCIYDRALQEAPVLHVMGEQAGTRFLVHFYAFVFMEDWRYDLWIKRLVRDHLRYVDEIQCAAARVVAALHQLAYDPITNPTGSYDSFHIRRGDFQYEMVRVSAESIYEDDTRTMIAENRTVFVATDESDRSFFAPLAQHYHLYFLKDFMPILDDVNPNFFGMIDQIVASTGQTFVGTYFSTFTGYINRMRGYQAQRRQLPGYEKGEMDSYYYAGHKVGSVRNMMRTYMSVQQGFWQQEFPVCWRDLDHDVDTSGK